MATSDLVCPACGLRYAAPDAGSVGTLPRCPYCDAGSAADGPAGAVETLEVPEPGRLGPGAAPAPRTGAGGRRALWWGATAAAGLALLGVGVVIGMQLPHRHGYRHGATMGGESAPPVVGTNLPGGVSTGGTATPPTVGAPGAGSAAMPADWPFIGWLQNVSVAMQQAAGEKKDLLILFDRSDSNPISLGLVQDLFSKPEFRERAARWFKLVFLDFAERLPASARIEGPILNRQTAERYLVDPTYPTILLTDDRGRPYGFIAQNGSRQMEPFFRLVEALREDRATRDRLLAEVARAQGEAKVRAAREAMGWLQARGLLWEYAGELEAAVREVDPHNERGELEAACQAGFAGRLERCVALYPRGVPALADLLAKWESEFRFKDANRRAWLHLALAQQFARRNEAERAGRHVKAAVDARPTNPQVRLGLAGVTFMLGYGVGAGFVAAPGGYVLTTHYAVLGPGRLLVRWPGGGEPVVAEVVARDEAHDLAVIRAAPPAGAAPRPVPVAAGRPLARGEAVAVLGQLLGGSDIDFGPKLTPAVVSALPEARNGHVLVIDANFNPTDRGGVACDAFGNVIGLATFRSFGTPNHGNRLTVPAAAIDALARKAIPGYRPPAPGTRKLGWDEVDRLVGPAVVAVYRSP